jgi:hypothetical protein
MSTPKSKLPRYLKIGQKLGQAGRRLIQKQSPGGTKRDYAVLLKMAEDCQDDSARTVFKQVTQDISRAAWHLQEAERKLCALGPDVKVKRVRKRAIEWNMGDKARIDPAHLAKYRVQYGLSEETVLTIARYVSASEVLVSTSMQGQTTHLSLPVKTAHLCTL